MCCLDKNHFFTPKRNINQTSISNLGGIQPTHSEAPNPTGRLLLLPPDMVSIFLVVLTAQNKGIYLIQTKSLSGSRTEQGIDEPAVNNVARRVRGREGRKEGTAVALCSGILVS